MMSEEVFSVHHHVQDPTSSSSNPNPNPNSNNPPKKKRNLPGTPDPDAEVVALSPKSLMAKNRFVCEICKKGFQRDQNLQLHRRGHNLPWKLKQRTNKDQVRKKVYVCPESTCVHHHPSRALGDLTGIKKHFSRKHGEKKWKCDKCSKKYAVQSDLKAHSKICGTREYKCHCGTIFSRKDSYMTHRAFCEALTEQSARVTSVPAALTNLSRDHFANNAQTSRIPQIFLSEFGSSVSSEPFGNYADVDNGQKLRLPLWLDHANIISHNQTGFQHKSSDDDNLMQGMDTFAFPPQAQLSNYRYRESTLLTNTNLTSFPTLPSSHGLKQEQEEENKGNYFSSLYFNGFGFNEVGNAEASTNVGGGGSYALNDSNNSVVVVNHMVMPVDNEKTRKGPISSRNNNQFGLTRDFLGVGDHDSMNRVSAFSLQHDLVDQFNTVGSTVNLHNQFGDGHYC